MFVSSPSWVLFQPFCDPGPDIMDNSYCDNIIIIIMRTQCLGFQAIVQLLCFKIVTEHTLYDTAISGSGSSTGQAVNLFRTQAKPATNDKYDRIDLALPV